MFKDRKSHQPTHSGTSAIDAKPQPSSIAYFKASKKHPKVPNAAILKTAKVFWPLSLFMRYHEKEDFAAMVDFAVGPTSVLEAKNQEFVLGDGPQAYNFAIDKFGTDPEGQELRDAADQAGDEWLTANSQAVITLQQHNIKFSRWREILKDPDYQTKRKEVFDCYYSTSTDFTVQRVKTAMDHTAFAVLDRFKERGEINDIGRGREMAVRFVLEECALFAHMALKYGFHFIAYPSDCPAAVEITKEIFVDSDPRGRGKNLLQWLRVGFRHPKPQHSITVPESTEAPEPEAALFAFDDNRGRSSSAPNSPQLHAQNGESSSQSDSQSKNDGKKSGSNSEGGSGSDEEIHLKPPVIELPPALQIYQKLLIHQINSFTQALLQTGELEEGLSEMFLNGVVNGVISGSPPHEGAKPRIGSPPLPKANGSGLEFGS